jgi:hypothetical protein
MNGFVLKDRKQELRLLLHHAGANLNSLLLCFKGKLSQVIPNDCQETWITLMGISSYSVGFEVDKCIALLEVVEVLDGLLKAGVVVVPWANQHTCLTK